MPTGTGWWISTKLSILKNLILFLYLLFWQTLRKLEVRLLIFWRQMPWSQIKREKVRKLGKSVEKFSFYILLLDSGIQVIANFHFNSTMHAILLLLKLRHISMYILQNVVKYFSKSTLIVCFLCIILRFFIIFHDILFSLNFWNFWGI